ncbi:MAG: Hpt domain-containing protein, partial [Rhodospirillales bacterium]|nr:Hpt domain-containing protein [Rhodospirillales bacterium]
VIVFERQRLDQLRNDVGDECFQELVDTFFESSDELMVDITAALAAEDFESIGRAAHSFKSASGSFGLMRLSKLCQDIETVCRIRDPEQVRPMAADLDKIYAEARFLVRDYAGRETVG